MIFRSDLFVFFRKRFSSVVRVLRSRYLVYIPLTLITVIITLFLYETEPFTLSCWNASYKLAKLSGFGFIYSGVVGCIIRFTPSGYLQPTRLTGRNLKILIGLLIVQILITCQINWIYMMVVFDDFVVKSYSFIHNVKHTASYCLFSFLFYILHLHYRTNPYPSVFRRQNKKHVIWIDKCKFIVEDILYIKSEKNYVIVYFLAGGKPEKKEALRCSLIECQGKLSAYPEFRRIHESYIANFKAIESYLKDGNSMKLKIKMIEQPISVGRTLQKEIKPLLRNIPREKGSY